MNRHFALLPPFLVPLLILAACQTATPAATPSAFDWCSASTPPDDACYASKRDPSSANVALAVAIAKRQATLHPKADLNWSWGGAVMFGSFIEVSRVSGDKAPSANAQTWLDLHIADGYAMTSSDTSAPAGVAVAIWQQTGDAKYHKPIEDFLAYIDHVSLRTPEGGLNHLGSMDALGISLWVDSLFMFGQPLIRLTLATGDAAPLAEMTKQVGIFIDKLQDKSGFFHHATEYAIAQDPDVYWGRGNGWVVWALADYLRAKKMRGETDAKAEAALRKLVAAVIASQDASGLWWTVLNRPGETYLETSAAALFAAGMARGWRIGVLGDEVLPVVAKAMTAVKAKVVTGTDGPVIKGVSGPTNAGNFDTYKSVGQEDDLPYGIGAVIFALLETSGLPAQ